PPVTAALIGALAVAPAQAPAVAPAVASAQTVAPDELGRVDVGLPASYFRGADAVFTHFRGADAAHPTFAGLTRLSSFQRERIVGFQARNIHFSAVKSALIVTGAAPVARHRHRRVT